MRWVTYLGLVLRRVWARRMMLLGSFLGATLVIALVAVLPLYESSVSAIDLLYTFRNAPDLTVDLRPRLTMPDYSGEEADAARQTVLEAAAPLRQWYPTMEERTVSAELVVIQLGLPINYLDGLTWLEGAAAWREAGADPEFTPWPKRSPEALSTRLFTTPDIADRLELVEGEFPEFEDPTRRAAPVLRVVLGEEIAALAGLGIGDSIALRASLTNEAFEVVEVAGIARPADPESVIWDGVNPGMLAVVDPGTFDAWAGTFTADPEADPWLRESRGFRGVTATRAFMLHLDREAVSLETVDGLRVGVTSFILGTSRAGLSTFTGLGDIVEEFGVRSVVFGAPILAMLALVVAGALYFLIYMASLALEREAAELALLRMRGASTWQTVGIHTTQSALIAGIAAVAAPFVARGLVALSGLVPPMSTLTGGEALAVSQARSVVPFVAGGAVLTFLAMGLAILPLARRGVLELRALASRPARQSVWQRYYLDVFLVVLAVFVLYELRRQGLVSEAAREGSGLDPFSIAAPALFLFSGALLLLRVLPLLLRAIGWVMTRFRGMAVALPGWHLGRNPVPYGRLALLVWLTTGFGAFALTYADTLDASYHDRAAYEAGADVRVVAEGAGFLAVPDDALATPVYRSKGGARQGSRTSEVLAVQPERFAEVAFWRSDFGDAALLGPSGLGDAPDWGVPLPEGATALEVSAIQDPRTWRQFDAGVAAERRVQVVVRVVDEDGAFRIFTAARALSDWHWTTATIDLRGGVALNGPFPDSGGTLVLQSLWVESEPVNEGAGTPETVVYVAEVNAVGPSGTVPLLDQVLAGFTPQAGLELETVPGDTVLNQVMSEVPEGQSAPSGEEAQANSLWREADLVRLGIPSRRPYEAVPYLARTPRPLAFVLDEEAAGVHGLSVGDETIFKIDADDIPGRVAGIVQLVPTATDPTLEGAMVTRLDGLMQWLSRSPDWALSGELAKAPAPQELWVRTSRPDDVANSLVEQLSQEPDAVLTLTAAAAEFSGRPIQVGLVAILFIGTGAGVVLTLAGVTAYVLMAVRRRFREMGVLRALGLRRRSVAATFAVEQLVVLGVGAVIGIGAGLGLMRLMLPFLQLGEGGAELMPPALMQTDWVRLAIYLGLVALVLVVAVLWSTRNVSARQLSEVLREVER